MSEDLRQRIEDLEAELEELAARSSQAGERREQAQQLLDELKARDAALSEEARNLQGELERLEVHALTYENTIERLRQQQNPTEHLESRLETLRTRIDLLLRQRDHLGTQLAETWREGKQAEQDLNEAQGAFGEAVLAERNARRELAELRAALAQAEPAVHGISDEQLARLSERLGERNRELVRRRIELAPRPAHRRAADYLQISTGSRRLDPAIERALLSLAEDKAENDERVEQEAERLGIVTQLVEVAKPLVKRFRGSFAGHILDASYSTILLQILEDEDLIDSGRGDEPRRARRVLRDSKGFAQRVSRELDQQIERFLVLLLDDFFQRQGIDESVAEELRTPLVHELRPRVLQRVAA